MKINENEKKKSHCGSERARCLKWGIPNLRGHISFLDALFVFSTLKTKASFQHYPCLVWVLWPFNGSFHLTALGFYCLPHKGSIVHRHEEIGDKYTLSATTTHHYFHPAISPSLGTMHYLTTYEDIHGHQVLWRSPPIGCLRFASPFLHIKRASGVQLVINAVYPGHRQTHSGV